MAYPLPSIPHYDYHNPGLCFGAKRKKHRIHAGCDLLARPGTEVFAVRAGILLRGPYRFYKTKSGHETYAIEVRHADNLIARYTEVSHVAEGVRTGSRVEEGQVIGYVGASKMLHFELYAGTGRGSLTDRSSKGYERRADLMDPTTFLDGLRRELHGRTPRAA